MDMYVTTEAHCNVCNTKKLESFLKQHFPQCQQTIGPNRTRLSITIEKCKATHASLLKSLEQSGLIIKSQNKRLCPGVIQYDGSIKACGLEVLLASKKPSDPTLENTHIRYTIRIED